jgi:hypothetical protein
MVFDSSDEGSITAGNYPQFRFYTDATDGMPLAETEPLEDGTYYISTFADLYCESSRTELSVTFTTPQIVIPPTKGGDTWTSQKWVGAFWKDDQTGERIIASPNTTTWSAVIDDENASGSWLNLDNNGGYDSNLGTDTPGDAESYQLPATRKISVNGTDNILFRIGVTGTDNRTASSEYKYPDGSNGKPPRYATITLTVDGTPYTIYCRQGEAADYVFNPTTDTYDDPSTTGTVEALPRSLAKKFSPYNLTASDLTENSPYYGDIAPRGGSFVDYPTQAGALFQWAGGTSFERRAYHPTVTTVSGWSPLYMGINFWNTLGTTHETCPTNWRRPNDGAIDASQGASNNIVVSEIRQSLFDAPKDGQNNLDETTGRGWGYYADGYFDRRPITTSKSNNLNSAVSPNSKDVAYIGTLFFNATSKHSLFMPAAGYRGTEQGALLNTGIIGSYWSSSGSETGEGANNGWRLEFNNSRARQSSSIRSFGFAVRCVKD